MNDQNLRPWKKGELSSEVAKRNGRKGAEAANRTKKTKKMFKEILEELLREEVDFRGPDGKSYRITKKQAMCYAGVKKGLQGDLRWFETIRDTIDEKPAEKILVAEVSQDIVSEVEDLVRGANDEE